MRQDGSTIVAVLVTVGHTRLCPVCQQPSSRVHSRYQRWLDDLPWGCYVVRLRLRVRRFLCNSPSCNRQTFSEQLPELAVPYGRQTLRLAQTLQQVGQQAGGEGGQRVAQMFRSGVSADTMLRLIRRIPSPSIPMPSVIGIDDWAFRKGQRYGTIVVDLVARRPIALLPDRTVDTAATWLAAHPELTIVSRDRGNNYIEAADRGAPQATQVADRWHILKNLREAVHEYLKRTCRTWQQHLLPPAGAEPLPEPAPIGGTLLTKAQQRKQAVRARRLARYEQVVALHQQGVGIRAIGQQLHLARHTVRSYLRPGSFPERAPRDSLSQLDPYIPYLQQRWKAGCHNGRQLWRELQSQGYRGGYSVLKVRLAQWRVRTPAAPQNKTRQQFPFPPSLPSPRQATWYLMRVPEKLKPEELAQLQQLCSASVVLATLYSLVQDFYYLLKNRQPEQIEGWLQRAEQCQVQELLSFVVGIRHDQLAVTAAATLPWSNGQVEGQICRLKQIKRQMYGRGKLDLLTKRVLCR